MSCIYCGADPAVVPFNEDHVVGRKFVPAGALHGMWNLIANACVPCNSAKGQLEDEISALTMLPSVAGTFASEDPRLRQTIRRKAKGTNSRTTGKPIAQSHERHSIETSFGPAKMKFSFVGAPHVPGERLHELAHFHARAFFGFITFNEQTRRTGVWHGDYFCVAEAAKADWGNEVLRAFSTSTQSWEPRFWLNGADGFFRSVIRRRPGGAPLWSFAVEWNMNYRVVAVLGNEDCAQEFVDALPMLKFDRVSATVRMRQETPLPADQDDLFHRPDWDTDHRATRRLDMRARPRKNSSRIGVLDRGATVVVQQKRRRWSLVARVADPRNEPLVGWVFSRYLLDPSRRRDAAVSAP